MKNFEKIKNMSIDEMAEYFSISKCSCILDNDCDGDMPNKSKVCVHGIRCWLESEAEDE